MAPAGVEMAYNHESIIEMDEFSLVSIPADLVIHMNLLDMLKFVLFSLTFLHIP